MELVFAVTALAAAVGAVARWSASARRARAARSAERVAIADAPEGRRARVVGTILDGPTVIAPISERVCVYYAITFEAEVGSGWQRVWTDRQGVELSLSDGTGRALVDLEAAEIEVERPGGMVSGMLDRATLEAMAAVRQPAVDVLGFGYAPRYRYREAALEVGQRVAVVGVAVREPDPDAQGDVAGYRDGPPTRLRLGSSPRQRLFVSDAAAEVD